MAEAIFTKRTSAPWIVASELAYLTADLVPGAERGPAGPPLHSGRDQFLDTIHAHHSPWAYALVYGSEYDDN